MAAAWAWRRSSRTAGKKVFIDLKLHDIPNTVERATAQIAQARRVLSHRPRLSPDDARGGRPARKGSG